MPREPRPGDRTGAAWDPERFDYVPLHFPSGTSRASSAEVLAIQAEYGGWELARVLGYPDGSRRVWLRRRKTRGLVPGLSA